MSRIVELINAALSRSITLEEGVELATVVSEKTGGTASPQEIAQVVNTNFIRTIQGCLDTVLSDPNLFEISVTKIFSARGELLKINVE